MSKKKITGQLTDEPHQSAFQLTLTRLTRNSKGRVGELEGSPSHPIALAETGNETGTTNSSKTSLLTFRKVEPAHLQESEGFSAVCSPGPQQNTHRPDHRRPSPSAPALAMTSGQETRTTLMHLYDELNEYPPHHRRRLTVRSKMRDEGAEAAIIASAFQL